MLSKAYSQTNGASCTKTQEADLITSGCPDRLHILKARFPTVDIIPEVLESVDGMTKLEKIVPGLLLKCILSQLISLHPSNCEVYRFFFSIPNCSASCQSRNNSQPTMLRNL